MTEISYLWDGLAIGDATEAPYDRAEFNKYIMGPVIADHDGVLVVPGYLNDLEITAGSESDGNFVNVATGGAVLKQFHYINSETTVLNIDQVSSASHFRYDFIILQINYDLQTARLVVLKGNETLDVTSLNEPTLTQSSAVWQAPLARVYIDGTTNYIQSQNITDRRKFLYTNFSTKFNVDNNLLLNSEFMAYSSSDGLTPPEYWQPVTSPIAITTATKPDQMSRGRAIGFDNNGIQQQISMRPDINRIFTVKGVFTATASSDSITFKLQSFTQSGSTITVSKTIQETYIAKEADEVIEFQFTANFDEINDIEGIRFIADQTGSSGIELGQVIIVQGYHPGSFREFSETILFRERVTDASWTDTGKSTSSNLINLSTSFGGVVLNRTKSVFVRLRANDSGSVGGLSNLKATGYGAPFNSFYGIVEITGLTNLTYREVNAIVPVNQSTSVALEDIPRMRLSVNATGANTLKATVEIIGVEI